LVLSGGRQGSADIDTQRSSVDFTELTKDFQAARDLFAAVKEVRITRGLMTSRKAT
jgi:hypothetical protein